MRYISRVIEASLRRYLKVFPVVGLTGPRQSGKSTLLRHVLKDYTYVTFDNPKNMLSFMDDPQGFLNYYDKKVIFDEVQYVPDIFRYIKVLVDNNRLHYGNFILTGSSQFAFLKNVSESLAGRMGLLSLLPFQYVEVPAKLHKQSLYLGSYPELVLRKYHEHALWYDAYVETYLNKDVRALTNIGDMRDFRRFLQLLAAQATQVLEMSSYARDLGVSVPTIKRWLSILEASYIIFIVPPFYENYGKRIIKSPKIYFYDTGLIAYFTGITTSEQYHHGPVAGALFENYIVSEVVKKLLHEKKDANFYYFRTQDKQEIDLIVDRKSSKEFIEIKKTATFHPQMLKNLIQYAQEKDAKILLYNGDSHVHRGIRIMNYAEYFYQ